MLVLFIDITYNRVMCWWQLIITRGYYNIIYTYKNIANWHLEPNGAMREMCDFLLVTFSVTWN